MIQLQYIIVELFFYSEPGVHYITKKHIISQREPWLWYGHLDFINFTETEYPISPSYINIVRDPIDRLLSFYHYRREKNLRYTTPLQFVVREEAEAPPIVRRNMTFNECVQSKDIECSDPRFTFGIIPLFCGQDPMCTMPSECALTQAKRNAENEFDVIGYLDNYEQFIEVVEYVFPQYFKGALKLYYEISDIPVVRHKSFKRTTVTEKTKSILLSRKDIQMEYDFYKFVKEKFDKMYKNFHVCYKEK